MEIITLKEVLTQIETGLPFDITYIKADKRRKVAGKEAILQRVVLHSADHANSIRRVLLPSGRIRPIHIRLITHFNDKRVIY